jgi:hypothetical protein
MKLLSKKTKILGQQMSATSFVHKNCKMYFVPKNKITVKMNRPAI